MKIRRIYFQDRENMVKFTSQIVSGYSLIYIYVYTKICTQDILKNYLHHDQKWLYANEPRGANCACLTRSNKNATEPPYVEPGLAIARF